MYSDDKAFSMHSHTKKEYKKGYKSEKWVYFLFTRKRVYSFIQFVCHSVALVCHSFNFDCYYAIIEMKIEAYGHATLEGSANSVHLHHLIELKVFFMLQLNLSMEFFETIQLSPSPIFVLNSDPMLLKGRCYSNNGELNKNKIHSFIHLCMCSRNKDIKW